MVDAGAQRFVDHHLEGRFVADREQFLRHRLGRGEEAGPQSGRGNDGTADLHGWDDIFSTPMPTYVYRFVETGETIEVQQAFTDATLTEVAHPDSGEVLPVKKVFTPVGVTFKGSGFFKTDNREEVVEVRVELVQGCGEQGRRDKGLREEHLDDRWVFIWRFDIRRFLLRRLEGQRIVVEHAEFGRQDGQLVVVHEAGEHFVVQDDLMLIPLADQATDLGAEVGVFGGSGFYEFLDDCTEIEIATPYGPPASPVSVGTLAGRRVAFLARHGRHHDYAAHRVPYRANVWALASVGVRSIVAPCSVGSLQPDLHPGDLVVVDQIDRSDQGPRRHVPRRRLRRRPARVGRRGAPPDASPSRTPPRCGRSCSTRPARSTGARCTTAAPWW